MDGASIPGKIAGTDDPPTPRLKDWVGDVASSYKSTWTVGLFNGGQYEGSCFNVSLATVVGLSFFLLVCCIHIYVGHVRRKAPSTTRKFALPFKQIKVEPTSKRPPRVGSFVSYFKSFFDQTELLERRRRLKEIVQKTLYIPKEEEVIPGPMPPSKFDHSEGLELLKLSSSYIGDIDTYNGKLLEYIDFSSRSTSNHH